MFYEMFLGFLGKVFSGDGVVYLWYVVMML